MGDARREQTVDTRRKLLARLAHEKLRFQTYHFPFPGIGYIRKKGEDGFDLSRNAGLGFNAIKQLRFSFVKENGPSLSSPQAGRRPLSECSASTPG